MLYQVGIYPLFKCVEEFYRKFVKPSEKKIRLPSKLTMPPDFQIAKKFSKK